MAVSAAQRKVAEAAERVLAAAGLPEALIQGALVNAYAESRLDPMARGDSGKSIGIWQLHEKWAGRGMSVADRQDVTKATRRILEVYGGSQGAPLRKEVAAGERNLGRLAYLWSLHVERPTGKEVEALRRRGLALLLFPGADLMASKPASGDREPTTSLAPPSSAKTSYAAPLLTVAALLGVLLVVRRRRLAGTA
jgi:hypothetical protein